MKHRIFSAVLTGALALVTLSQVASADHLRERGSYRGDTGSWRDSRDDRDRGGWNDRGYRGGERRSYYYEDPYCGYRSQYISDFKDHYARAGHGPLILKIDIRTGALLARYRYDYRADEWRSWDRDYRRGGRDRDDRRYDERRRYERSDDDDD